MIKCQTEHCLALYHVRYLFVHGSTHTGYLISSLTCPKWTFKDQKTATKAVLPARYWGWWCSVYRKPRRVQRLILSVQRLQMHADYSWLRVSAEVGTNCESRRPYGRVCTLQQTDTSKYVHARRIMYKPPTANHQPRQCSGSQHERRSGLYVLTVTSSGCIPLANDEAHPRD